MAYAITMKSTISTAIIVLESEGRLEERYWNHLRVQNNGSTPKVVDKYLL